MTTHYCTFVGCAKSSQQPFTDGWTHFTDDDDEGALDGYYCPEHAQTMFAVYGDERLPASVERRAAVIKRKLARKSR
jgi:hypothetical protein